MHFTGGGTYELFADVNVNGIWDAGEKIVNLIHARVRYMLKNDE